MPSQASTVELRAVSKSFVRAGLVVDDVNMRLQPGEFVALLGPSGCGKSTLLRIVAGLERTDAGVALAAAEGRSPKSARGFVFQDACLLPWRTALENASLPLELLGVPKAQAQKEASEALRKVGLGDALFMLPRQLSGGMKMRASLARALVAKPSLLLLDEPFAALDENSRLALQEDLRTLWENLGMTVLFVTHSAPEAAYLAERAIVLSPKPARVILDHAICLPSRRRPEDRRSDAFAHATKTLYEAMTPARAMR